MSSSKTTDDREVGDRVTFRPLERQLQDVDELVEEGQFPNRTEALREAIDRFLEEEQGIDE